MAAHSLTESIGLYPDSHRGPAMTLMSSVARCTPVNALLSSPDEDHHARCDLLREMRALTFI
jgi:hypothetical protein